MLAAVLLLSLVSQSGLEGYHLEIDPAYIDSLMENPFEASWYPAHISCPGGDSDCMVTIRGNTSSARPNTRNRMAKDSKLFST